MLKVTDIVGSSSGIPDAGGTFTIDSTSLVQEWYIRPSQTGTLTSNVTITNSGAAPVDGSSFRLNYEGGFNYNGNTFTIFGSSIPAHLQDKKFIIKATYEGGWTVGMGVDVSQAGIISGTQIVDLDIATADIADNAVTLAKMADLAAQGYIIRAGVGGVLEGYNAAGSAKILIGDGTDVVSVSVSGAITITAAGVVTIAAGAVANSMLAAAARGSVKVGGVGDAVTDLDASTDAQILIGDGTDLNSVAISGHITINNAGVVTIANGVITAAMMVDKTITLAKLGDTNLAFQNVSQAGSGTSAGTDEETLLSGTLSADTVGATGDTLYITAHGTTANTANAKTIRVRLGGSGAASGTVVAVNTTTASPQNVAWTVELWLQRSGSSAGVGVAKITFDGVAPEVTHFTSAEDFTNDLEVKLSGENGTAAANDIVAYTFSGRIAR